MDYKVHALCMAVPEMGDDEYKDLVVDMKENGFRATDPIAVKEGWIIDGRHRFLAAADAAVEPLFVELEEPWEQIPAFVASRSKRRNLTAGQRAAAASAMATRETGAAAHRDKNENFHTCTIAQACKVWNISNKYIADFRKIETLNELLAKEVRCGNKTLNAALTEAKKQYEHKATPEDNFKPEPEPEPKPRANDEPEDFGNPFGQKDPDPEDEIDEALNKAKAKAKASAGNKTDYAKQDQPSEVEQLKIKLAQAELKLRMCEQELAKAKAKSKGATFDAPIEHALHVLGIDVKHGTIKTQAAKWLLNGFKRTFHPDQGVKQGKVYDAKLTRCTKN